MHTIGTICVIKTIQIVIGDRYRRHNMFCIVHAISIEPDLHRYLPKTSSRTVAWLTAEILCLISKKASNQSPGTKKWTDDDWVQPTAICYFEALALQIEAQSNPENHPSIQAVANFSATTNIFTSWNNIPEKFVSFYGIRNPLLAYKKKWDAFHRCTKHWQKMSSRSAPVCVKVGIIHFTAIVLPESFPNEFCPV